MNDDKGTRQEAIESIEENFQQAVDQILGNAEPEEEIDESNPFWAPVAKAKERLAEVLPDGDTETVNEMIQQENDFSKYIDQT